MFLLSIAVISNKRINKYYWVRERKKIHQPYEIKGRVKQYQNLFPIPHTAFWPFTNCCLLCTRTLSQSPPSQLSNGFFERVQKAFSKHDKVLIPRLTPLLSFLGCVRSSQWFRAAGSWWQVAGGRWPVAGSSSCLTSSVACEHSKKLKEVLS